MKLYDHPAAPNTRRVRVFLAEKGVEVPKEEVDLMARAQHEPDYLAVNPLATVPALELDDGTVICESMAICRYFELTHPEPPLMGTDATDQARVEMWQRRVEINGMMAAGEAFRNATPAFKNRAVAGTREYPQIAELAERGRQRVTDFFAFLDKSLEGRDYIAGDRYTVADITGLIAVDFAGWSKLRPDPSLENLNAWYERVSSRPSAKA